MYWNKIIPELSVTNLENSLKFYKTAGFKEFPIQDPDGYLLLT